MKLRNKTYVMVLVAAIFLDACSTARPKSADPLDQALRSKFQYKTMAMWCFLSGPTDCQSVRSRLQHNGIEVLEGRYLARPEKLGQRNAQRALIEANANYVMLVSTTSFEQKSDQE